MRLDSPTNDLLKSAADKPFSIRWNPIMFGNASVRTVFPVPGGPNNMRP